MSDTSIKEGPDLSAAKVTWLKIAHSECHMKLLTSLIELEVGFSDIDDYNLSLNLKLRSKKLRDKGDKSDRRIVKEAMSLKLRMRQVIMVN